jgi:hypothetical protein
MSNVQISVCRGCGVAPKVDDEIVICDEGCYDPDPDDPCSDRVGTGATLEKAVADWNEKQSDAWNGVTS